MSASCKADDARDKLFDYNNVSVHYIFSTPRSKYTYVSPNAEFLPVPPSVSDELHSIHSLGQPRYAYDTYFYLALVPLSVEFDGPLLGCLSPTSVTIEPTTTKRGNTFFQLTSTLQKQWQSCEAIILELQRQLTRRAGLLYLETSVPPPPTAFGYVDSYHSRSEALLHLKKALSAFTARLAFLSYLVLRDEMKGLDTWTELALQRDPLPLAICNAFRLSWISDWTVPRVGAFVDIGRHILPTGGSHWHEDVRLFLSKGTCIPLWFTYTSADDVFRPTCKESRVVYNAFKPSIVVRLLLANAATMVFDNETCDVPLNKLPWNHCYSAVSLTRGSVPSAVVVRRRRSISTEYIFDINRGTPSTFTPTTSVPPSHGSLWHKRFRFRNRQLCGETNVRPGWAAKIATASSLFPSEALLLCTCGSSFQATSRIYERVCCRARLLIYGGRRLLLIEYTTLTGTNMMCDMRNYRSTTEQIRCS
ncbi:hypothetical protein BC629DRAFT_582857 [Irpex lacteus]|nr:hypothetical protein BC629DRAFT_582857 [Irpex lacteus]